MKYTADNLSFMLAYL